MNIQQAYNVWANNYDEVINKTRDLEAVALRQSLASYNFENVLELGCGTGKNTEWLLTKTKHLTAVDFSNEMLAKAKEKINATNVQFVQADLTKIWNLPPQHYDAITCSLALEHIEDLNFVFNQAKQVLKPNGIFYIGELHPFKQYQGSKARFDTNKGVFELECFVHHIADFFKAASDNGLQCINLNECFDDNDRSGVPRIISMLFCN